MISLSLSLFHLYIHFYLELRVLPPKVGQDFPGAMASMWLGETPAMERMNSER